MFENKGDTSPPERGRSPAVTSSKPSLSLSSLSVCDRVRSRCWTQAARDEFLVSGLASYTSRSVCWPVARYLVLGSFFLSCCDFRLALLLLLLLLLPSNLYPYL